MCSLKRERENPIPLSHYVFLMFQDASPKIKTEIKVTATQPVETAPEAKTEKSSPKKKKKSKAQTANTVQEPEPEKVPEKVPEAEKPIPEPCHPNTDEDKEAARIEMELAEAAADTNGLIADTKKDSTEEGKTETESSPVEFGLSENTDNTASEAKPARSPRKKKKGRDREKTQVAFCL